MDMFWAAAEIVPAEQAASDPANTNSLIAGLDPYYPGTETLGANEMRISFPGTSVIPRLAQACNSVFVETGSGDQFVFDCGAGVVVKYNAMGIANGRMNKIFLTHIHGDHMSDLTYIYCFGPAHRSQVSSLRLGQLEVRRARSGHRRGLRGWVARILRDVEGDVPLAHRELQLRGHQLCLLRPSHPGRLGPPGRPRSRWVTTTPPTATPWCP